MKTGLGVQVWLQYSAASLFKALAIHFSIEAKDKDTSVFLCVLHSLLSPPLCMGMVTSVWQYLVPGYLTHTLVSGKTPSRYNYFEHFSSVFSSNLQPSQPWVFYYEADVGCRDAASFHKFPFCTSDCMIVTGSWRQSLEISLLLLAFANFFSLSVVTASLWEVPFSDSGYYRVIFFDISRFLFVL